MKNVFLILALLLAAGPALAADPPPDCSGAAYREFDFWIGEFQVQAPDGATWATVFDGSYRHQK